MNFPNIDGTVVSYKENYGRVTQYNVEPNVLQFKKKTVQ